MICNVFMIDEKAARMNYARYMYVYDKICLNFQLHISYLNFGGGKPCEAQNMATAPPP